MKKSLILSIIVFLSISLIPKIEYEARMAIAITLAAIILWVFETIPFSFTAILTLVAFEMFHVISLDVILSGFSTPALYIIVAGMMMVNSIQDTTLGERLAYWILLKLGRFPGGVLAGVIIIPQITAFFVPMGAVRTAMLIPIVLSILHILKDHQKQLMMGVAVGGSISGTGLLPASIGNIITVELLAYYTNQNVSYIEWLTLALPFWFILIPFTIYVVYRSFPTKGYNFKIVKENLEQKMKSLGPMGLKEKRMILYLFITLILWLLEPLHGWHPVIPALIGVSLMAFNISKWDEMVKINFDTILLIGATISLGKVLDQTKAISYVTDLIDTPWILSLFENPYLAVLVVAAMTQLIHLVTSNVATATITSLPIVVALAAKAGAPVFILGFVAGINSLFGFILVVETLPNILAYSTGYLTQKDFIKPGIILSLITIGLSYLFALTWWHWLGYL